MPIYEYECGSCHFHFERKQRFDEEPVAMCPKCGGKARRVIHSVPIIFKGSGFYTTDSRKNVPELGEGGGKSPGGGKK
jgi:putative FmdB family regulatory protein